jgi:hypothetical protein
VKSHNRQPALLRSAGRRVKESRETSDTAAAAFDSDVPRVAGHKATAEELKGLSDTLDAWLKESGAGNAG